MTPIEARFEIDKKLVELAASNNGKVPLVRDIRFFLYPGSYQHVLACVEREDGAADIEVYFDLPVPVASDSLDENAVRDMFLAMPSGAKH